MTGFARAARETFSSHHTIAPQAGVKGLLGDVAKILEALAKLPQWLLMVAVGGYLIYAGQQILVGQRPWPF